jgi:hypothetical protein
MHVSFPWRGLWVAAALAAVWGCRKPARVTSSAPAAVRFQEISAGAGVTFRHLTGARGKMWMPETMGSGVAFLDYDRDGWQDLLCVNSTAWPGSPGPAGVSRLYHNNGDGTFEDLTAGSGLETERYGMGAAVGDYDNDGYPDLYLTAVGPNALLRNTLGDSARAPGAPIFHDVTAGAGVAGEPVPEPGIGLRWKWSTSAAWLDYDRDGRLDLFVCGYVKWSPATDRPCLRADGTREYCTPAHYEGLHSVLYRSEGAGRFRDVSAATGIRTAQTVGKAMGVAVADYNEDGWPDLAVANDTRPNFLFLNQEGKRFSEQGVEAGIAVPESGKSRAGMGIDAGDWENSGHFGLVIGNFSGEALSLFSNEGRAFFTDRAHERGVAEPSMLFLTFGAFFFDYDLDGRQDVLAANGYIDPHIDTRGMRLTYRERPLLFRGEDGGRFREVGEACGLTQALVGRGAAWADIDNDGDPDLAVLSNGEGVRLYRNDSGGGRRWLRLRLVGHRSNRDGIGAVLRVTAGGIVQSQTVHSGGSYLSESQREPLFGLGSAAQADRVEIRWPSGAVTRAGPLQADRRYVADETEGIREEPPVPRPTESRRPLIPTARAHQR